MTGTDDAKARPSKDPDWTKRDLLARYEAMRRKHPERETVEVAIAVAKDLYRAIARGGLDISPCRRCSADVVCIPDGLTMCDDCAKKESN